MGGVTAIVAITALAMLGFILRRADAEKGWRDQAEGLRERWERDELPRAYHGATTNGDTPPPS